MKVADLKSILAKGEDVMLLDVREADEYQAGDKIDGAQNMPMGKVFVEEGKGILPKDRKIVTICKKGGRCEIVAKELAKKGYNIDHLEGGMDAWKSDTVA